MSKCGFFITFITTLIQFIPLNMANKGKTAHYNRSSYAVQNPSQVDTLSVDVLSGVYCTIMNTSKCAYVTQEIT